MTIQSPLHRNILVRILADIYADKTVGPYLGFKGGTAAYLFYGLDRFSIDLDFDLLDFSKKEHVFQKIGVIMENYGVLRDASDKHHGMLFVISYDQKEPRAQNIKLEINTKDFDSTFELKSYMGISMLVMAKADMFAHKLVAMMERLGRANRDMYDVWFFAKYRWPIHSEMVEKRSNVSFNEFLRASIASVEEYNDRTILDGLGELLTEKQKQWVKVNLKQQVLFSLRLMLDTAVK